MQQTSYKRSLQCIKSWFVNIGLDHPLCHIRLYHVLSPKECSLIIKEGERIANERGGWKTNRHNEAPTTDIPFDDLGGTRKVFFQHWKRQFMKQVVSPVLLRDYQAHFVSFDDLFLVRYAAREQPSLKVHRDGTIISFVVQLNNDFTQGGTFIEGLNQSLNHQKGQMCVHSGWFRHGACAVTQGVRYALIGFCNIKAPWFTQHKLTPSEPFVSDAQTLRKGIHPAFRNPLRTQNPR